MPYTKPVYASGNPVVDQLFGREFSAWQAEDRGRQADEANQVARAQIAAQSQLAQAQQRANIDQQQYANLFRMQELTSRDRAEAARNKISQQEADTKKTYYEGLNKRPDARSQAEVDEMNATSEAVAEQFNAAYQTRLKNATAELEARRKVELGTFSWGNKDVNAKYDQLLNDSVDQITQEILDISIKNASGSVGFDPLTKKFRAVRLGGGTAATSTANPAALGTTPVVPTVLPPSVITASDGSSVAAGLGTTPVVAPVVAPVVPANPAALGPTAQAVVGVGQPLVNKVLGSAADMFGVKAPVVAPAGKIQVPIDEASALEMSGEDAAEAARQLRSVPPEQVPAVAAAIRDSLIKSGRARIVVRPSPMQELLKSSPVPLSQ